MLGQGAENVSHKKCGVWCVVAVIVTVFLRGYSTGAKKICGVKNRAYILSVKSLRVCLY